MPTPKKHVNAAARQAAYRKRKAEARRLELQKKGLPALPLVPNFPGEARWKKMLAEAAALLSMVVEEREAYFDDRSEEWQPVRATRRTHSRSAPTPSPTSSTPWTISPWRHDNQRKRLAITANGKRKRGAKTPIQQKR